MACIHATLLQEKGGAQHTITHGLPKVLVQVRCSSAGIHQGTFFLRHPENTVIRYQSGVNPPYSWI